MRVRKLTLYPMILSGTKPFASARTWSNLEMFADSFSLNMIDFLNIVYLVRVLGKKRETKGKKKTSLNADNKRFNT